MPPRPHAGQQRLMNKGARMVCDALLGLDFKTVVVAGKPYTVSPPTIRRIAGAARHLSCFGGEKTFSDVIRSLSSLEESAKALSWLIQGDGLLWEELAGGGIEEVAAALEAGFSLVSVAGFLRLSASARNVAGLAAKPKQQVTPASSGR